MTEEAQCEVSRLPYLVPSRKRCACLGLGAVFWAVATLLWWQQARGASVDQATLFFFDTFRREGHVLAPIAKWVSSYGMVAISLVYGSLALLSHRLPRFDLPASLFLLVILSMGVSGIGGDLLKEVFDRPRPLATYGEELVIFSEAATPALPSGHATKSMALALPILLFSLGRVLLLQSARALILTLGVGVALSRIVLGAHYVSDVLAGIGTALVGLPLAVLVADRILNRVKPEKMPKMRLVWGMILIVLAFLLTLV